jgi:hypothetical protein
MFRVFLFALCLLVVSVVAQDRFVTIKRFNNCYGPVPRMYGKGHLDHYWEKICDASQSVHERTMRHSAFLEWFDDFERDYFDGLPQEIKMIMDQTKPKLIRKIAALSVLVDMQ